MFVGNLGVKAGVLFLAQFQLTSDSYKISIFIKIELS